MPKGHSAAPAHAGPNHADAARFGGAFDSASRARPERRASLVDGFVIMADVIGALFIREMRTRYANQTIGYLWAFVQPLSWVVFFAIVYHFLNRRPPVLTDMVSFLATAFVTFFLFRSTMLRCIGATRANKPLLYFQQVRPFDFCFARAALEFFTHIVVLMVILLANFMIFGDFELQDPVYAFAGLATAGLLGFSLGFMCEGLGLFIKPLQQMLMIAMRPLFWISALFFTARELPLFVLDMIWWNPALHVVEAVRDAFFHNYTSPVAQLEYPLCVSLVCLFIGFALERIAKRRPELT